MLPNSNHDRYCDPWTRFIKLRRLPLGTPCVTYRWRLVVRGAPWLEHLSHPSGRDLCFANARGPGHRGLRESHRQWNWRSSRGCRGWWRVPNLEPRWIEGDGWRVAEIRDERVLPMRPERDDDGVHAVSSQRRRSGCSCSRGITTWRADRVGQPTMP